MANKRTLKKEIRRICGDIAGECIVAKALIPGVDKQRLTDAVIKVAELQTTALTRTNIVFDKTPADFASQSEYKKAHREYFKKAYKSLNEGFNKQVVEIVKEMNEAMPPKK